MQPGFSSGRRRLLRWRPFLCVLLIFLLGAGIAQAKSTFTWSDVFQLIEAKFPGVPTIDIETLQKWRKEDPHLLLIDVRKEKEFTVSRIPGAAHAQRLGRLEMLIQKPGTGAVLYCSVGYRSAKWVERLQKKGFSRVYNLKGSIFEWANQGNRLVNDGGDTTFVHPYNDHWGQLLNRDRHPPE